MDIEEQFGLEHLLFKERKCRTCGETKDLLEGFYLTRKNLEECAHLHILMNVRNVLRKEYYQKEAETQIHTDGNIQIGDVHACFPILNFANNK